MNLRRNFGSIAVAQHAARPTYLRDDAVTPQKLHDCARHKRQTVWEQLRLGSIQRTCAVTQSQATRCLRCCGILRARAETKPDVDGSRLSLSCTQPGGAGPPGARRRGSRRSQGLDADRPSTPPTGIQTSAVVLVGGLAQAREESWSALTGNDKPVSCDRLSQCWRAHKTSKVGRI